jgi:glycosyltransferase involved in cell wall biosynthesis
MVKLPLVSICIPTYNRAGMVRKAIDSALSQTYRNIEVLVVDNASNDEIESVIAGYNDPRLQFFKNKENLGIFGNFNRCVEVSHGEYIHILHSDDFIDPNFTKTCVEFIESHPNVMMTFSSAQFLSGSEQKRIAVSDHDIIYPAPEGFRKILETGNPIICPSVMMKRGVYDSVGLYSREYPYAGDFYQWLKISREFDFAFVANAILFYRLGDHTESFQFLEKTPLGYIDIIKILFRTIADLGDDATLYRRELNIFLQKQVDVCLGAGIWQSDRMKTYSPLVFIGFALNMWTLIHPDSAVGYINKFFEFCIILAVGFVIILPGGRSFLRKILRLKQNIR